MPLLWLLCATAALPLYYTLPGGFTFRSPDLLALGAAMVAVVGFLWRGWPRPVRTPIDVPFAILWVVLLASVLWSEEKGLYVRALRPWVVATAFFYVLASVVTTRAAASRVLGLVCVGLVVQATVGVWQLFAGWEGMEVFLKGWGGRVFYEADVIAARLDTLNLNWRLRPDDLMRVMGLSVTPSGTSLNATLFTCLMAVLAVIGLFGWAPSRRLRCSFTVISVIALLLSILSLKRSGWVAMAAPLFFLPFAVRADRWRSVVVVASAALVIAVTVYLYPPVGARLANRGLDVFAEKWAPNVESVAAEASDNREHEAAASPGDSEDTVTDSTPATQEGPGRAVVFGAPGSSKEVPRTDHGRASLWRFVFDTVKAHPLLGVGLGQWSRHGPWTVTREGTIRWGNTESFYLQLLVELGPVPLLCFGAIVLILMFLVVRTMRRGGPSAPIAASAGAGLVALAIGAAVNSYFAGDQIWPTFFALAVVIIAASRNEEDGRDGSAAETLV